MKLADDKLLERIPEYARQFVAKHISNKNTGREGEDTIIDIYVLPVREGSKAIVIYAISNLDRRYACGPMTEELFK